MSDIVTIAGSHGAVRVHRPTGIILEEAEGCTCEDCQRLGSYVQQVALFDTADLTGGWAAYDIVYVGFWDRSGCYEPAISHRFHHHPSGFVDVDACALKALLPAPNVEIILHGFYTDEEGNDTFSDREDEITGWCVYLRRNNPSAWGDFDIDWEEDFETYEAASDFAKKWASAYGIEVFEQV